MAQWQIMKSGVPLPIEIYDDRSTVQLGDEGFTNSSAMAYALNSGGDDVSYVGPSPSDVISD